MIRPLLILALLATTPALAHPGGLAEDGCHLDKGTGQRHCHPERAAAAPSPAPVRAAELIAGTASVIDGDTLEIHGRRIRLHGIDAPESRQTCRQGDREIRCGQQAALALADRIARRPVSCEVRDMDRYGRSVARCSAGGEDLNGWMVAQGHAVAYRQYSKDYVTLEEHARAVKQCIWATEFMMPAEWRKASKR